MMGLVDAAKSLHLDLISHSWFVTVGVVETVDDSHIIVYASGVLSDCTAPRSWEGFDVVLKRMSAALPAHFSKRERYRVPM